MSQISPTPEQTTNTSPATKKFQTPDWTLKGERRAWVNLKKLETLWINTGTLCNIECINCYIESSPTNDRLEYITRAETRSFLDELADQNINKIEIGFTGGEPFMNPDMIAMAEDCLNAGHKVAILTNAMQPMQRPSITKGLLALKAAFADKLLLRVSLDHYSEEMHNSLRGKGAFAKALEGLDWLTQNGFNIAIAGRTCWNETDEESRQGYANLIQDHNWPIDPADHNALVLFPEMDEQVDVPEITTSCWDILNLHPDDMMCASSRMIVKHKGAKSPSVMPCTLLPYDKAFDMGATLEEANKADGGMFTEGGVKLCHQHCAKFCVLGGGSCSA